jgi:hypothetical protein
MAISSPVIVVHFKRFNGVSRIKGIKGVGGSRPVELLDPLVYSVYGRCGNVNGVERVYFVDENATADTM